VAAFRIERSRRLLYAYTSSVPKVWSETIESHRQVVRDVILDTTGYLVAEHGFLYVTMSHIAEQAGIGRATLYKYFPDVESVLTAWHTRQVAGQLEHLQGVRDRTVRADERLKAVLEAFAILHYDRQASDLDVVLHEKEHVAHASRHLKNLIKDLVVEGVASGQIRSDIAPAELAGYCLHALKAANVTSSKAAARRLVNVILAGLQPLG
jgi:AcrR family transcriptional regulator